MILKQSRKKLDRALNDDDTTIFLLSGDKNSKAREVHDFIEEYVWAPWDRWFLVTGLSILKPSEKQTWFDGANVERYAVLGGAKPKSIAQKGPITELLRAADSKPAITKIERAFAAGDAV